MTGRHLQANACASGALPAKAATLQRLDMPGTNAMQQSESGKASLGPVNPREKTSPKGDSDGLTGP